MRTYHKKTALIKSNHYAGANSDQGRAVQLRNNQSNSQEASDNGSVTSVETGPQPVNLSQARTPQRNNRSNQNDDATEVTGPHEVTSNEWRKIQQKQRGNPPFIEQHQQWLDSLNKALSGNKLSRAYSIIKMIKKYVENNDSPLQEVAKEFLEKCDNIVRPIEDQHQINKIRYANLVKSVSYPSVDSASVSSSRSKQSNKRRSVRSVTSDDHGSQRSSSSSLTDYSQQKATIPSQVEARGDDTSVSEVSSLGASVPSLHLPTDIQDYLMAQAAAGDQKAQKLLLQQNNLNSISEHHSDGNRSSDSDDDKKPSASS